MVVVRLGEAERGGLDVEFQFCKMQSSRNWLCTNYERAQCCGTVCLEMVKKPAPVAHACNPSYSGGRDQEDHGLKPA
jgi:hypothetical protein